MNKSVARALVVLVFIFGFYILVVGKLYKVQVLEHDKYVLIAKRQSYRAIKVNAERGKILDRNGEVLLIQKMKSPFGWIKKLQTTSFVILLPLFFQLCSAKASSIIFR